MLYYIFRNDNEKVYSGDQIDHSFSRNPFSKTEMTRADAEMVVDSLVELGFSHDDFEICPV